MGTPVRGDVRPGDLHDGDVTRPAREPRRVDAVLVAALAKSAAGLAASVRDLPRNRRGGPRKRRRDADRATPSPDDSRGHDGAEKARQLLA